VEAGKNTSTVIPASRKRRRKGNPVVSDEAVLSSAALTTDRLHYKLQTRPIVRECAPRRRAIQFSDKGKEKVKSGHGPQRGARHQGILTDRPSESNFNFNQLMLLGEIVALGSVVVRALSYKLEGRGFQT
jgi:hypothetical protein